MKKSFLLLLISACSVYTISAQVYDSGNKVGIGTYFPVSKLEIADPAAAVLSISTGTVNGSTASPLRPAINFLGYLNGNKARISATEETADTYGSKFSIHVNDGESANHMVERLTILPNGNVGIGTSSPHGTFEIANPLGTVLSLSTGGLSGTTDSPLRPAINFLGCQNGYKARISATEETANTYGSKFSIYVNNGESADNMVERLTILPNGNVGIGTSSPHGTFEIANPLGSVLSLSTDGLAGTPQSPLRPSLDFLGYLNGNKARISATDETSETYGSRFSIYVNDGESSTHLAERFTILPNGYIGIGSVSPAYKLDVNGTIRAREIKVDLDGADFVFESDYKLMPLNELEEYVTENKHLPEIATAKEMQDNGTDLGRLNTALIQKIEELTLYSIEQNKKIVELEKQCALIGTLSAKLEKIESKSR